MFLTAAANSAAPKSVSLLIRGGASQKSSEIHSCRSETTSQIEIWQLVDQLDGGPVSSMRVGREANFFG
jgi:hypothetical protein